MYDNYNTGNFADEYENDRPESSLDPDPEDLGLPVSEYNNGQGIKYVITFHPTLPPLKASESADEMCFSLAEVVEACILAIGRDPQLLQFKVVGTQLRTMAFMIKYSIPGRSALKDMQLTTTGHYDELNKEAVKKGSPEVKLEITEDLKNVSTVPANTNSQANDGQSKDELALGPQQKKRKLTGKEEEIAETIVQLKATYMCANKRCSSLTCFLGNPTGQHVQLTPMHLSTWASAILAKHKDVDLQTPPTDKMFYPLEGHNNVDDISLLARRHNQSNKAPVATTNITVNPDYNGLVNLFQLIQNPCPATPVHYHAPAHPPSHPPSPVKPAALTFELVILEIDGPHLLKFIGDTDLDKYLSVGQRASLRYTQLQWKKGLVR
ncbi:hypothetical protein B0H14DRAFT_3607325 [Mycena olivaceomarginata]|nr:hypothetical protein B0H14DRAFT_3607325 [Mycena olivaceomarginata]